VSAAAEPHAHGALPTDGLRRALRIVALLIWSGALVAFWYGARQTDAGALDFLFATVERLAAQPWAPLGVLALYAVRPLMLVPITVANLAAGFVMGLWPGLLVAFAGTLTSASVGYGIGRTLAPRSGLSESGRGGRVVRALRRRSFESVVAGGLMYLHADAVNFPAGMLRMPFALFLVAISIGNALTMTSAVLAGASVEGGLRDAGVSVDGTTLLLALVLFTISLTLAAWLRRRNSTPAHGQGRGRASV